MAESKTYSATCPGCHKTFTAKSPRAKWCSRTCKNRVARAAASASTDTSPEPTPLVRATERELTEAGVLESFDGQLAVELARRVSASGAAGVSGLVKELRQVMAKAKGEKPPEPDDPEAEDLDTGPDELDELQRLRDEKRAAAGLG